MAKKKDKKPAYGERPTPVECEPCEPVPMYVTIPEDEKEVNDNEHT